MSALDQEFTLPAARPAAETVQTGRARRLWTSVHRWIGIVAGTYFFIAAVTGSILAFWQDIDEWLNRDIARVAVPAGDARYRPLDKLIAAAKAAMPAEALKRDAPINFRMPRHPAAAANVTYLIGLPDKEELAKARAAGVIPKIDFSAIEGHQIFIDPYSGRVTGERLMSKGLNPFSMPFIQIVNQLHLGLWIPFVGGLITALLALFLLIGVIDGLVLWWPRAGKWKRALTPKKNPSSERFIFDLHKIFGVYFSVVLVVSIFSGMYMNFKPPWRALVSTVSPLREKPADLHSQAANGRKPLSVDAAVAIVDRLSPDGALQYVNLPVGPDGVYKIGKHLDTEVNEVSTHRNVVLDQYSGDILFKEDPRDYTAGEKFFEWQYPLHSGEAFGNYGRAFMVFFGAVPAVLFVTGVIRWRQKRRARRAVARKAAAPPAFVEAERH